MPEHKKKVITSKSFQEILAAYPAEQRVMAIIIIQMVIAAFAILLAVKIGNFYVGLIVAVSCAALIFFTGKVARESILSLEDELEEKKDELEEAKRKYEDVDRALKNDKREGNGKSPLISSEDENAARARINEAAKKIAKEMALEYSIKERAALAKLEKVAAQTIVSRETSDSKLVKVTIKFHSSAKVLSFKEFREKIGWSVVRSAEAQGKGNYAGAPILTLGEAMDEEKLSHSWNEPGECQFSVEMEALDSGTDTIDTLLIHFPSEILPDEKWLVVPVMIGLNTTDN